MQHVLKPALIAAAACRLAIAVSSPSQAQNARYVYPYPAQHYSIYQNPDGTSRFRRLISLVMSGASRAAWNARAKRKRAGRTIFIATVMESTAPPMAND